MTEKRDDGGNDRRATSAGWMGSAGMSMNINWVSGRAAWDTYDTNAVLNLYLIARYDMMKTFTGNIDVEFNSAYMGLQFEY